jgi:hypothetical protein
VSTAAKIRDRWTDRQCLVFDIKKRSKLSGITAILPDVPPAVAPETVRQYNKSGTPLSSQGYPMTPWYVDQQGASKNAPPRPAPNGAPDSGDDDPDDPDDGLPDPYDFDQPDQDDEPYYCQSRHPPRPPYIARPSAGQEKAARDAEVSNRRRTTSTSLYYTANPMVPMANQVMWLHKSIDGPYAGKHERLAKCAFKLLDDLPGTFFVFYNLTRSFLGSTGFHPELLPALQHISELVNLTLTPIHLDMPRVGEYGGGERKPMSDWIEAHNEFNSTLYALFASQGVIGPAATRSRNILVSYQFSGSGVQVLQDLICLHHPGHKEMQAPAFMAIRTAVPTMPLNVATGEQLSSLTVYFMAFGNWEAHLKLYPDARYIRESEYHLLFLNGLAPVLRNQVLQEKNDLLVFQRDHRSSFPETVAPTHLHARGMYTRLSAIVAPLALENGGKRQTSVQQCSPVFRKSSTTQLNRNVLSTG